ARAQLSGQRTPRKTISSRAAVLRAGLAPDTSSGAFLTGSLLVERLLLDRMLRRRIGRRLRCGLGLRRLARDRPAGALDAVAGRIEGAADPFAGLRDGRVERAADGFPGAGQAALGRLRGVVHAAADRSRSASARG